MAVESTKMFCPKCGAEMNHHADKVIDPVRPEDMKHVDAALDGIVNEMHSCPACGAMASRLTK